MRVREKNSFPSRCWQTRQSASCSVLCPDGSHDQQFLWLTHTLVGHFLAPVRTALEFLYRRDSYMVNLITQWYLKLFWFYWHSTWKYWGTKFHTFQVYLWYHHWTLKQGFFSVSDSNKNPTPSHLLSHRGQNRVLDAYIIYWSINYLISQTELATSFSWDGEHLLKKVSGIRFTLNTPTRPERTALRASPGKPIKFFWISEAL